ncbi:F-box only protein 21 [Danaus plexippus plexippus]|uniref:F-box only protein 21 n=1 Tax=Danaus plexippus plexippus TaxID=278856 RepID=A0A212EVA0_DANPL|nr:F-box only protein 21 [Danaus plexippus plexippus]
MDTSRAMSSISSLPNELITLILINNEPKEILNFGSTCKKFNEIVNNNEYLWRIKYSEIVPRRFIKSLFDGTMLQEVKNVYKIRRRIQEELKAMSPKYYVQVNEVSVEHVRNFYAIATESHHSFYYTIFILQDIVDKSRRILQNFECINPINNLTGIYYAKIVLRHLIHMFLSIKWVRELKRDNLTPQVVLMFFLQWIDCDHLYSDGEVYYQIHTLVEKVKNILDKVCPSGSGDNYKELGEREILRAITHVIYKQENFSIAESVKIYNFNIVKVIEEGDGEAVVYSAIYQAVARYFGIECEMVAFPNHLFLTWRDKENSYREYTIDLHTGQLKPKGKCPYSQKMTFGYGPDPLIHYLLSLYMTSKGSYRDRYGVNCVSCTEDETSLDDETAAEAAAAFARACSPDTQLLLPAAQPRPPLRYDTDQ